MRSIRLITFDIFGTLLDWQAYVEQSFPGHYGAFREASVVHQAPSHATFPYRNLLYELGVQLNPRASREVVSFFADSIGFAKAFNDSRAVQLMAHMTMLGVVSNCDFRHLLDVQRTLGTVFDVALVAEDMRAYKPHAAAWDHAFDMVTRKLGFDRQSWLHVSAYADSDLIPAKERGIHTCFLPRPGGSDPTETERLAPDYVVSDMWQLANLVAEINGAPLRYSVQVKARDNDVLQRFLHFMRYEHGPDLLSVRRCQEFQVVQTSPTEMQCEYTFTNRAAYKAYLDGPAIELRKRTLDRFSPDELSFTRSDGEIVAGYCQRSRTDFSPQRQV